MGSQRKVTVEPLTKSIKRLCHQPDSIHIAWLRFPNFKNLEENARIDFDFPITVLLGRNGTNKSSILHALYGAPRGSTVADFWFETDLDAIPATRNDLKQSFAYGYEMDDGSLVECIKARAPRQDQDPDYWESVKPTKKYGFPSGTTRHPPIPLEVLHLDFRGELPAFDKYFYFPDPVHLAQRRQYASQKSNLRREYRKQDYLRQRTKIIKNRIDQQGEKLKPEELEVLGYILEREYLEGIVLEHSLFHGHMGSTIIFKTPNLQSGYTEAFAGSGESAATMLVHKVHKAPKGSLILLDEPETSLHPRAQQRLIEFLADQAAKKRLQVVMATHSIYLAEQLPQQAIRVLDINQNGRVQISASYSAREALHEIGTFAHSRKVLVEDSRAKHIVVSALELLGGQAAADILIQVREGGTSSIYADTVSYAHTGQTAVFFLLDGDHRPSIELPSHGELPQGKKELSRLVSKLTKGKNEAGPKNLGLIDARDFTRYIDYFRTNIRFLPSDTPEELVWDEAAAMKILRVDELPSAVASEPDGKMRIREVASQAPGLTPDTVFNMLVYEFLRKDSDEKKCLLDALNEIRAS